MRENLRKPCVGEAKTYLGNEVAIRHHRDTCATIHCIHLEVARSRVGVLTKHALSSSLVPVIASHFKSLETRFPSIPLFLSHLDYLNYTRMAVQDRTTEFRACVSSIQNRTAARNPVKQPLLQNGKHSTHKSEFSRMAASIGKDLSKTTANLGRLAQCAFS